MKFSNRKPQIMRIQHDEIAELIGWNNNILSVSCMKMILDIMQVNAAVSCHVNPNLLLLIQIFMNSSASE